MAKERKMPHSVEAEQSVLGCVLIDNTAAESICEQLTDSDFYVAAHKIIFESMFNIYKNNNPVDFVTLTDELERKNMIESIGGIEYITRLTNFVPSASNFQYYVDIVKKQKIKRDYIAGANKILNTVYNDTNFSLEQIMSDAEKTIFDIGQDKTQGGFVSANKITEEVINVLADAEKLKGALRGIPTGFYSLDKLIQGLQPSDLILIAARPGMGKTSLGLNIATNAAIKHGKHVAVFSLEMSNKQLLLRTMCSIAHVDMQKAFSGKLNSNEWQAIWGAIDVLNAANLNLNDKALSTTASMLSQCRRLKREKGLDLILVDYLQLMQSKKTKENRQAEVAEISRELKILAKELDVPVIVLSQLSREVEKRKDHRPVLSDLRESGAIEQDADIVIFINREMNNEEQAQTIEPAELIIAKHRNGPTGSVLVKWHGATTTFLQTTSDANKASLEESNKGGK